MLTDSDGAASLTEKVRRLTVLLSARFINFVAGDSEEKRSHVKILIHLILIFYLYPF